MIKNLLLIPIIFLGLWSCGQSEKSTEKNETVVVSDPETLRTEINTITKELRNAKVGPVDKEKGQNLIDKTIQFSEAMPKDTSTANYLFLAGEVARGIGNYDQAIALFKKVHMEYPRSKRAPAAMFLQAFTFENDVKDITKAKKLYNDFLYKFRGHPLEEQIIEILKVIDKSPEDLIKEFKAKQGQE